MTIPHIEPTHTIDVETVRGWVRLELTEAQAGVLAFDLATLNDLPTDTPESTGSGS
jgi:hypothetical protein